MKTDTTFAHFCHAFVTYSAFVSQESCSRLVTHLSLLDAPQARFVPPAQINDLKIAMHSACQVCYHSKRKKLGRSPKIGWIRRAQVGVAGHITLPANCCDFFETISLSRFP